MNKIIEYAQKRFVDKKVFNYIMWSEILICIIGFMIGRITVFGQWNPLSIAYLGSTYQSKNLKKWNSAFIILGILSSNNNIYMEMKYIGTIGLIFLIRKYMDSMDYKSNLLGQVLISTISTFVISLIMLIQKGVSTYGLIEIIIEMVFIFTFSFIYEKGIMVLINKQKNPLTHQQVIGITLVVSSIIGGMIELYIEFGQGSRIYVRDIICFFLILGISYLGNASVGAAMGTVIGTLLVIIGYIPPHLISIYALAGLGGGLLSSLGKLWSSIGVLAGHIIGIYFINNGIMDMSLIGAYIIATIIFLILPRDFFGFSYWFGENEKEVEQAIHMDRIKELTTSKLEAFSAAFNRLASTFDSISVKKTSFTQKDISYLFEDVIDNVCKECGLVEYCWKKDFYNTYQGAYSILEKVERKNHISPSDVPEEFKKSCMKIENFVQALNQAFELHKQELIWHNRIVESRELIGEQLKSVSDSIKNLSREIDGQVIFKRDLEKQLKEELLSKGIRVKEIIILLNSNKKYEISIITNNNLENTQHKKHILKELKELLDIDFKVSYTKVRKDTDDFIMKIEQECNYAIVVGTSSVSKIDKMCGDQYSAMEVSDGQYLLALSDGMGSGLGACIESTATIELLEEFINSGFDRSTAIKMINSVLILKSNNESFTTMDMTIVDLYTGIAEFIKIGAAVSFIKREDEVEVIRANSLPVGILKDVDLETQQRKLKDGDIIVMVTDGILDAEKDKFNQESTFIKILEEIDSNNPKYISDTLLEKSQDLICGEINDDMTIIVARIWDLKYKS